MTQYKSFDIENTKHHTEAKMFLDDGGGLSTQRYDVVKYKQFEKLTEQQLSYFWRPEEIDITKDSKDFKDLTDHERHIFTSNLKRQILLDSVQGRAPNIAFLPICTLPELEAWITTWAFSETIHSRSYTHIIRNVYPDPSKVFDTMMDIQEIIDCASDISENYDSLISSMNQRFVHGDRHINDYTIKKLIYLCMMSVNILEGVRFYVSFACSWNFAELKKMEGNAKIIKLICRDENLHLAGTQTILKLLPKDDPDFIQIAEESKSECVKLFTDAVEQEKAWARYLFKDGSMIGLNEQLLCDYVEWIAHKRMTAVGLPCPYKVGSNPLPWTQKWIAGSDVQVAPQEVELSSYQIGTVKQDVTENTFTGFSL